MKQFLVAVGIALVLLASGASAAPLQATYVNVVTPDTQLQSFLHTLAQTAKNSIGAEASAYAAIDAMIAPTLGGYSKGLDPFEEWQAIDPAGPDDPHGLYLLTNSMVEMGELPEGQVPPDYRPDFLALLLALIANPEAPLGTMKEMPGAICSPARYDIDIDAASTFAAANNTDGYGLYIYPRELELHAKPQAGTPVTAKVAPRTLVATDYQDNQPDNWTKIKTSEGATGWIEDRGDYEGLSQQHLCFGKVDGTYKIVGFFTYGL